MPFPSASQRRQRSTTRRLGPTAPGRRLTFTWKTTNTRSGRRQGALESRLAWRRRPPSRRWSPLPRQVHLWRRLASAPCCRPAPTCPPPSPALQRPVTQKSMRSAPGERPLTSASARGLQLDGADLDSAALGMMDANGAYYRFRTLVPEGVELSSEIRSLTEQLRQTKLLAKDVGQALNDTKRDIDRLTAAVQVRDLKGKRVPGRGSRGTWRRSPDRAVWPADSTGKALGGGLQRGHHGPGGGQHGAAAQAGQTQVQGRVFAIQGQQDQH